jgi:DNA polymerase-3 subunit gamma/tau
MKPLSRDGEPIGQSNSTEGDYVVVARRYRPQVFGDLVGQGLVSQALKNAILTDRVGHAYLFTGARGVGKTSTARILAKALNCIKGPTPEPCGTCDPCLQIADGEDVDVLEIDGASNRGIDEIRQLRSNVGIRPSRSKFKIYIIDEVHMLTKEAFNALLKTLEEPPLHVKFIFCTTEPTKIPITVLSRCQRFDFSPVDPLDIANRLAQIVRQEGAVAEPAALELLARRAAGSMRDSQSLLEQLLSFVGTSITVKDVHQMLGTASTDRVRAIIERLIERDSGSALDELHATLSQGVDSGQLGEQLLTSLRDIMALRVGCDSRLLLFQSPADADQLREQGSRWGIDTLLAATQILDQAVTRMRHSMYGRILLEVALVRIARLEDLDQLSTVVSQLTTANSLPGVRPVDQKKKN